MSLLEEQMLPKHIREIPQMYDLLQAEEGYLEDLLSFSQFLEHRMILLRAVVMNVPNLQKKIESLTGLHCSITEDPEHLLLRIRCFKDAKTPEFSFRDKILHYIPAHLKVVFYYQKSYSGLCRSYLGSFGIESVRYRAEPMERNRKVRREGVLPFSQSAFSYVRWTAYPKEG